MEDLKEIGYEGGKTTHGDVRRAINANNEVANGNFDELSSAVQDAAKAAQGATETAQAADAAAGEAKQTAEAAKGTAEGAAEAAAEAQRVAGAAEEVAEGAAATAEAAQEAATGAQSAAETAARDAATAKQDAATAKSDAASAKSTAEGAQSTAETAASNASAALEAAQAAQGTADTAKETASTANGTAGAAKTAADKAAEDAAAAKSDAATAKSTAETAKSTAEEAKASAEGLTGGVTELGQQLEEVSAVASEAQAGVTELGQQLDEVASDAADAADGLHQFMTMGILTQAPFGKSTAAASGSFAAVGGNVALADGEIIPWTGWLTLALCYETTDSAAKVKLTGYAGPTLGNCELIGETAVAASSTPRVVRITGEHDYNPGRNGSSDACMVGSSYHVNVEVQNPNAEFTLLWAVVYESDEYGNPRRRGGSIRRFYAQMNTVEIPSITGEVGYRTLSTPKYNERTGWFELNGLTDVTWATMEAIAADTEFNTVYPNNFTRKRGIRTNKVGWHHGNVRGSVANLLAYYYQGLEVVAMPSPGYLMAQIQVNNGSFSNCGNLFALLLIIEARVANIFDLSEEIETCYIIPITTLTELSMKDQAKMSWESIKWMIDAVSGRTSTLTVTVHADVYAKLTGGTVDNWGSLGTLAEEKGVKLVAYGESGYPFLTRVLWHGYKRLENKINAAKSGDVIYLHPDDRRKITAAQQDDWAALVTAGAEKQISFALPAES